MLFGVFLSFLTLDGFEIPKFSVDIFLFIIFVCFMYLSIVAARFFALDNWGNGVNLKFKSNVSFNEIGQNCKSFLDSFRFSFWGDFCKGFQWNLLDSLEFHGTLRHFLILRALRVQLTQLTEINPVLCAECIINRIITWKPASYTRFRYQAVLSKNVNATYFCMKCAHKKNYIRYSAV